MMTGYHGQPEKTREAEWFDATGKRFIRTGDVGRFDADGFLTLFDRRKDMIISGGFNIYPATWRRCCASTRRADVAVVGVPSEWGETPVALSCVPAPPPPPPSCGLGQPARRQDPAPGRPALHRRAAAQRHRQGAQARAARGLRRRALTRTFDDQALQRRPTAGRVLQARARRRPRAHRTMACNRGCRPWTRFKVGDHVGWNSRRAA
jgi:acyl-CoA synthetase (AMP-forming)/AMP-acid ligase II